MASASGVERATDDCFLLYHTIGNLYSPVLMVKKTPEVLLGETGQAPKSASVYAETET